MVSAERLACQREMVFQPPEKILLMVTAEPGDNTNTSETVKVDILK
jgi:hypothetical protein